MGLQGRQSGRATNTLPPARLRFADPVQPEWLAVQVRAGRELFSARHLQARGYDIFLPAYLEQRRWSDRVMTVSRALFEGYVFCRVVALAVGTIISAPGVLRIVGDSSGPLPIPLDEIEALQRISETRLPVRPWPFLQAGQHVRVEAGPLSGTEGVVLTVKDERRLVVSITLLQRSVAVEIAPEWVIVPGVLAVGRAI